MGCWGHAGAGEPAQDLVSLCGAQPQRGRVSDHVVVLLGDQFPADRPGQRTGQLGQFACHRGVGQVEPGCADVLQPGQQLVAEQPGEGEPDHRGAVGVDVVGLDRHLGAVVEQPLHHRGDLGGRTAS